MLHAVDVKTQILMLDFEIFGAAPVKFGTKSLFRRFPSL